MCFEKKYFILVFLLLSIIFYSCEKKIEYKNVDFNKKALLFSFPTVDSSLVIYGGYSTNIISDNVNETLNNIPVEIIINDTITYIHNFVKNKNKLVIPEVICQPQMKIKIKYMDYNNKAIWSEVKIPNRVDINKVDTLSVYELNNKNEIINNLICNVLFQDEKNNNNFYVLDIELENILETGKIERKTINYDKFDKVFKIRNNQSELIANYNSNSFNDLLFYNKEYSLTFKINKELITCPPNAKKTNIIVKLFNVTKDYYLFLRTYETLNNENIFNVFYDSYVYFNVNNGFGIVGAMSVSEYKFNIMMKK